MKHFSDHETSTLRSNDFVSVGGSRGDLTRHSPCEEFEPMGVVREPTQKLAESSTQLGGVGASKLSTRNYETPQKDVYNSLSSVKVARPGCAERTITESIEKAGNTSVQEKQFKSRSKASTNVDSVGIRSKGKPGEKSATSRYCGASRSQSEYTTDHTKTTPTKSIGAHKPNKSADKVEAGKGHYRPRVKQTKAASSVTGRRLDKSKQH